LDTLKTLYAALIRPHLEYIMSVWDPHLHNDIDMLESIQRFATKNCCRSWNALHHKERLWPSHFSSEGSDNPTYSAPEAAANFQGGTGGC